MLLKLLIQILLTQSKQSGIVIKRPGENTIADYLCKSYPGCNVTTICQRITYMENKNKTLNKRHNGKHQLFNR